jgi:uncharacterized protein (TIGR04255 family)
MRVAEPDPQPITFGRPPVNEVALAIQFSAPLIDVEVLGALTTRVKQDYPGRQQQPPLPRMQEPTGLLNPPQIEIQPFFPGLPRTWFVTSDGHFLIQAQPDRIAINWRRLGGDVPYPRYAEVRRRASELIAALREAVESVGAQDVPVDFLELSYFNEVVVPETKPGAAHPNLARFLRIIDWTSDQAFLGAPEDSQLQARWRIPPELLPDGANVGRLYVAVLPGLSAATQTPVYLMNLVARIVPPIGTSVDSSLDIADVGHDWIVRGFADLTTDEIHEQWGGLNNDPGDA